VRRTEQFWRCDLSNPQRVVRIWCQLTVLCGATEPQRAPKEDPFPQPAEDNPFGQKPAASQHFPPAAVISYLHSFYLQSDRNNELCSTLFCRSEMAFSFLGSLICSPLAQTRERVDSEPLLDLGGPGPGNKKDDLSGSLEDLFS